MDQLLVGITQLLWYSDYCIVLEGDKDFDVVTYDVEIQSNITHVPFNVSINDDNIFEGNENFTLTITSASLPTGITIGKPSQTTVTILDDDRE